jgi:2-haloacid dehalogenase
VPLPVRALAFDAYGTLFDVFSVTALAEELFPGKGAALAQAWRTKRLQYSLLRSLMERHADFWRLTEDGLVWAANSLQLDLAGSTWAMPGVLALCRRTRGTSPAPGPPAC